MHFGYRRVGSALLLAVAIPLCSSRNSGTTLDDGFVSFVAVVVPGLETGAETVVAASVVAVASAGRCARSWLDFVAVEK